MNLSKVQRVFLKLFSELKPHEHEMIPVSSIHGNPLHKPSCPGLQGTTESPMPIRTAWEWKDRNMKSGGGQARDGRAEETWVGDWRGVDRQAGGDI